MSLTRDAFILSALPIERDLKRLFPRRDARVVFDIGSCEGEDAIRYASFFPHAIVYAVEPLPRNIPRIRENLVRHPRPNVRILPVALSDGVGTARFYVSSGQPPGETSPDWDHGNKSSSLLPPEQHLAVHPWVRFDEELEIETDTLERVCRREGVDAIDVAHVDVQGAELKVLAGAGPLLERIKVVWMEVEAVPLYRAQPLKRDVELFMAAHGFRKLKDTVDLVAGDQLYVNARLMKVPLPSLSEMDQVRWLRAIPGRIRRRAKRLFTRLH